MNKRNPIAWVGTLALLLAGFLAASTTMAAAEVPDSEQVAKLLSEAKTIAFQLKEDAAIMESFTRSDLNWGTHAGAIIQIKEHVNALERQATKLKEVRSEASATQRAAIDRMTPFLDELEGYTEAIIERINDNPRLLNTAEYKDYLEANADYSADLAAMIGSFVDYGRTKQRLQRLADKLEVDHR